MPPTELPDSRPCDRPREGNEPEANRSPGEHDGTGENQHADPRPLVHGSSAPGTIVPAIASGGGLVSHHRCCTLASASQCLLRRPYAHLPLGIRPMNRALSLILAAGLLTAAMPSSPPPSSSDSGGYLGLFIDPSVSPAQDFFQYAVGKWLRENPIPANERSWGIGHVVQEETYQRLNSISEAAAADRDARPGSNTQKIGDFWYAGMDTVMIERQGITPLASQFARIEAARDTKDLLRVVGQLQRIGVGALCGLPIFQDEMNSDRYALHLYQGGLGLPDRDYYFDTDDRSEMLRREYVIHVAAMFRLLGDDSTRARRNATTVMTIETELAKASRKLEDLRDPRANYHAMSVTSLSTLTPSVRWRDMLEQSGIKGLDSVVVGQPEFFRQVEKSLRAHKLGEWKTYLRWQLVHTFAAQAGGPFDAQNFHFFGTILNGTPEQRPRWKRVLDEEEN